MGSKLEFKVVHASGSDSDYPAEELNKHSPHTRGWQSARFCEYPQEVILELRQRSVVRQVQILSHQHKIATRVELFIGAGARGYENATWTRLGYLSLDANERSEFQARELKSVYVECRGRFLKLVVHRCHINRHNLFNQVGLVAANLLGEYTARDDVNEAEVVDAREPVGPAARREPAEVDDLAFDMNVDPRAARQVRALLAAKEAAVAAEDYDAAKRLKNAERQLGALGSQLAQLEVAKRRAVRDEDYDRAKLLKGEIATVRRRVDEALRACDIDAIATGGPDARNDHHHFVEDQVGYTTTNNPTASAINAHPSSSLQKQHLGQEDEASYATARGGDNTTTNNNNNNNMPQGTPDAASRARLPQTTASSKMMSARSVDAPDPPLPSPTAPPPIESHHHHGGGGGSPLHALGESSLDASVPSVAQPPSLGASASSLAPPRSARASQAAAQPSPSPPPQQNRRGFASHQHDRDELAAEDDLSTGGGGGGGGLGGAEGAASSSAMNHKVPPPREDPSAMMDAPPYDDDMDDEAGVDDDVTVGEKSLQGGAAALAGVPNCEELPTPEPLSPPSAIEPSEVAGLVELLGEYRARCLFSKNWALREAAVAKVRLMVQAGDLDDERHALERLSEVCKLGVSDKIAQVYLTSLTLLEAVCASKIVAKRKAYAPLEATIKVLLAKLGENQPRLREGSLDALTYVARCKAVGAAAVGQAAMKTLDAKKHAAHNRWRPVASRLALLRRLVLDFGVGSATSKGALNLDAVMGFVAAHGCFAHTFEEVRNAARELTVAVYLRAGADDALLEPYIEKLRPKQVEEYRAAFDRAAERGPSSKLNDAAAGAANAQNVAAHSARRRSRGSRNNSLRGDSDDDVDFGDENDDENHPSTARAAAPRSSARSGGAPASAPRSARPQAGSSSSGSKRPAAPPSETHDSPSHHHHGADVDAAADDLPVDDDSLANANEDDEDPEEERFRDQIMKQLEDKAFSVHEAYEILQQHFGTPDEADAVKDGVLLEWVSEIGDVDTHDMDPANLESRNKMLMQVATWLFQ